MPLADMNLSDFGSLACALIAAGMAAYMALRKDRREGRKSDVELSIEDSKERAAMSREERESAIQEWKDYAKSLTAAHKLDVQRLADRLTAQQTEIDGMREREMRCLVEAAGLRAEVAHLKEEVTELRAQIAGLRPKGSP